MLDPKHIRMVCQFSIGGAGEQGIIHRFWWTSVMYDSHVSYSLLFYNVRHLVAVEQQFRKADSGQVSLSKYEHSSTEESRARLVTLARLLPNLGEG